MASYASMMEVYAMIEKATSLDGIAKIINSYPSVVFSQIGVANIIKALPKLLTEPVRATSFNAHFIDTVIHTYGLWHAKAIPNEVTQIGGYRGIDGPSEPTWAFDILKNYVHELIEISEGKCLSDLNLSGVNEYLKHAYETTPRSAWEFLGWLYFVFDWDIADRTSITFLETWSSHQGARQGFLRVFRDILEPNEVGYGDVNLLDRVWATTCAPVTSGKYGDWNPDCFIYNCRQHNLSWLHDRIDHEYDGDANADELFLMLGNALAMHECSKRFFFEYILEIGTVAPTAARRTALLDEYDPVFGDDTLEYMEEFSSEVLSQFSLINKHTAQADIDTAKRLVSIKAEKLVRKMFIDHPEATPEDMGCFFESVAGVFGYGFSSFAMDVVHSCIDYIIVGIYNARKSEEAATESTDYWGILIALEGAYGDDDGEGSGPSTGGVKANTVETAALHQKAKTRNMTAVDGMKAAERKVYSGYRKFKQNEEKIDSTFNRAIAALKKAVIGDQEAILIEGKTFSVTGFLKKLFATVGIFNYSKIAAILAIVVTKALRSKTRRAEKKRLLMELEAELEMVNEKIEDARGDGNREAKYDLMRTRNALQNAIKRLKYGMGAEVESKNPTANHLRSTENYRDPTLRG